MKTLILLRHAKSSWKNPDLADHDRPLKKRGKRDAPRMGQLLRRLDLVPDAILTSTAKRARKTAEIVAETSGFDGPMETTRRLYFTDPATWYELIQNMTDDNSRVMIVGHNPGMEEFLELVSNQSETLPTAALVQLEFDIGSWQQFQPGLVGAMKGIWRPRELKD